MTPSPKRHGAALLAALLLAGCTVAPPAAKGPTVSPEEVGEIRAGTGILRGYLDRKVLPDSLALLPPPPAAGSPGAALDRAAFDHSRTLIGSPRWLLAAQDADLNFPRAAQVFACAMNMDISAERTPHLNMLLRRTLADAGLSTYGAKDHYKRQRPFVALKVASCNAAEEPRLVNDGSYPSGHAALGWAWALVLTELAPERTNQLLARGYAYGQSRVVCGVHWQSDVDMGRVMGAAAVARLHADPVFVAQLAAARQEVQAQRAAGAQTRQDCAAESAALK